MQKCVWVCIVKPTNRHLTIRAGFIVAGARYDGYLPRYSSDFFSYCKRHVNFPSEFLLCDKAGRKMVLMFHHHTQRHTDSCTSLATYQKDES